MWRLSEDAQADANELYRLLGRSALFRNRNATRVVIERLAARGEPGAIPAIAHALFERTLREAAAAAISQLFANVPPKELIHLGGVLDWLSSWYISESWSKLSPRKVSDLAGDGPHRTSVLGLLSFHHNGFVRHEAVKQLAKITSGAELRFLLIRQNDWVDPICRDAQQFTRERLTPHYLEHFSRQVPLVVHLLNYRRRDLSGIVTAFVERLIRPEHASLLEYVLAHEDRKSRRCVADLALGIAGPHHERVVRIGIQSSDPVLRLHCSRKVGEALSRDEAIQVCNVMLSDAFMPVRREGYLLKTNLFPESKNEIWRGCLLDQSRSMRELARFYLRDTATDIPTIYRRALSADPNQHSAVAGIAETGDASDLPVLRALLASPRAGIRAEAIRGIGRFGTEEDITGLVRYLADDSPRVSREAAKQLEPHAARLGPEYLAKLLTADLPQHAGRNILRMVFELGRWQSLPVLIRAAAMDHSQIASPAEQLIELWFTPPRSVRVFTQPTETQRQQLLDSLTAVRDRIRPDFLAQMLEWLKTYKLVPDS